jgi:hypothetical protein
MSQESRMNDDDHLFDGTRSAGDGQVVGESSPMPS